MSTTTTTKTTFVRHFCTLAGCGLGLEIASNWIGIAMNWNYKWQIDGRGKLICDSVVTICWLLVLCTIFHIARPHHQLARTSIEPQLMIIDWKILIFTIFNIIKKNTEIASYHLHITPHYGQYILGSSPTNTPDRSEGHQDRLITTWSEMCCN